MEFQLHAWKWRPIYNLDSRWKKKQYATGALNSISLMEQEGGGACRWVYVGCEPINICHFPKGILIFGANFCYLFWICRKRFYFLLQLCKLKVVCNFSWLCLAIIYKLKGVISQTNLFHKIYIHISPSTYTLGGIAKLVAFLGL